MHYVLVFVLLVACARFAGAAVNFTVTPSSVSNTYYGAITLQVTGLTSGDTVVVQKFLDANSNGVVDAGDYLFQQFTLTDGQASVFTHGATSITNVLVPGDMDTTAGQITALLYQSADFSQRLAGNYLFVVSSPPGHFAPVTNSFSVTNYPFAQKFTGLVTSNGVAVPYAAVLVFQPVGDGNNPQGGALANGSGAYTIPMQTGTSYTLVAFKTNFLANMAAAAGLALGSGQTITTNLSLIPATQTISGKVVDTNNSSIGIPGLLMPVQTKNGILGIGSTDTNGNFSVGVTPNQWKVTVSDQAVDFHGYLRLENDSQPTVDTTGGSVNGITLALPKATAIFYGTVTDNLGHPVGGIDIFSGSADGNGTVGQDSYTLTNGNYLAGALAGVNWLAGPSSDANGTNYVYPQGNSATLSAGQAFLQNFTILPTTGQITGYVKFTNAPVTNVQVTADATINGTNYHVQTDTDGSGNYVLNVANGTWNVSVSCNGGSDSLDGVLGNGSYQCPNNQTVTVNNNNTNVNFNVQLPTSGNDQIFGQVTDVNSDPISGINVYANGPGGPYQTATDGGGNYSFMVSDGTWDISVDCAGLNTLGFACVSDQQVDICCGQSQAIDFVAAFNQPLQITTTSLPRGTNGAFYSQALQVVGGQSPYTWSIPGFSANPPSNLSLSTNGTLSGTPSTTVGVHYFDVIVMDSASNAVELDALPITIVNTDGSPLQISGTSLPLATIGVAYDTQLAASGGQTPYTWSLALGSAPLPSGLSMNTNGLISGMPTTNKTYSFKVQVTDASFITTNRVMSITVSANTQPVLSSPAWSANKFQARLTGAASQNYTLQMSTNAHSTNWISLYVTNNLATNSFIITDSNATNKQRFYRVLVGP
jgi:hypothetical protein